MALTRSIATSRYSLPAGTNQSLAFDGVASFATVPVTPAATGFCIGFWTKTNVATLTQSIADWQTAFDTDGFQMRFDVQRLLISVLSNGASPDAIISKGAATATSGKWYFVTLTYLPNNAKMFIGGVQAGSTDTTISMTAASGKTLTLGKDAYGASRFLNGNIKNFTLHNTTTPWTQTQINDLMYQNVIPNGAIQWSMNGVATDQNGANALTLSGTSYSNDVPFANRGVAGARTVVAIAPATMLYCRGNVAATNINPVDSTKMQIGVSSDWSGGWKATLHQKTIAPDNDDHCLGNYDLNFGAALGYAFYAGASTGYLRAVIGSTFYTSSTGLFTYGAEHWFIFTLTGTTLKGYVDGVLVWTVTVVRKATGGSVKHLLTETGAPGAASRSVKGFVKDIFSTLLLISAGDISNVVNNDVYPTCDFRYKNDQGAGSAVIDLSGNANNGLITVPVWRTIGRALAG